VSVGPIEAYVHALARVLPGPRRMRAELLRELADGLDDAAEAYARAGLSRRQAEAKAVGDCGRVDDVAPCYRRELVAATSRRTAMLVALSMPATVLAWTYVWTIAVRSEPAPLRGNEHSALIAVLAQVTDWAGYAGGASGLVTLGLLTCSGRLGGVLPVRPVVIGQVVVGLVVVALTLSCSVAMNLLDPTLALQKAELTTVILPLGAATGVLSGWLLIALWRTFRVAVR
jgi:hypothetical protein